jgi:hypothetical protein
MKMLADQIRSAVLSFDELWRRAVELLEALAAGHLVLLRQRLVIAVHPGQQLGQQRPALGHGVLGHSDAEAGQMGPDVACSSSPRPKWTSASTRDIPRAARDSTRLRLVWL